LIPIGVPSFLVNNITEIMKMWNGMFSAYCISEINDDEAWRKQTNKGM